MGMDMDMDMAMEMDIDMASAVAEHVLGNPSENQDLPGRGANDPQSRLKFLELFKKDAVPFKEQPRKVNKDSDIFKLPCPEEANKLQTIECAEKALDHYNANMDGPEYELVNPVCSNCIIGAGYWIHASFTARPISSDLEDDPSLEYFFAEVSCHIGEKERIFCVIVDPDSPDTTDGCRYCPPIAKIFHPKSEFEAGTPVMGRDIEK